MATINVTTFCFLNTPEGELDVRDWVTMTFGPPFVLFFSGVHGKLTYTILDGGEFGVQAHIQNKIPTPTLARNSDHFVKEFASQGSSKSYDFADREKWGLFPNW